MRALWCTREIRGARRGALLYYVLPSSSMYSSSMHTLGVARQKQVVFYRKTWLEPLRRVLAYKKNVLSTHGKILCIRGSITKSNIETKSIGTSYHEQPESTTGPPFTRPSISATSTWRGRVVFFFIQVILFLAYT